MNKTILTALTFASTFAACSEIEAVEHTNPDARVVVEESPEYIVVDTTQGNVMYDQAASMVMEVKELGFAVYEAEVRESAEIEADWVGYDHKVSFEIPKDLAEESQLWYELSARKDLIVSYVGVAPENMISLSIEQGHKVVGIQDSMGEVYESDMAQGIAEAVNKNVDYLYIPIEQTQAPELVLRAASYAAEEGVLVFDRFGSEFEQL